ncbi:hypothetical protein GCM10022221_41190 [Actinocorallia aurea]
MPHECVDLVAAARGRVPAQRLRQARFGLRPWRTEPFVADLDDHIHTSLIGLWRFQAVGERRAVEGAGSARRSSPGCAMTVKRKGGPCRGEGAARHGRFGGRERQTGRTWRAGWLGLLR